MTTTIGLEVHDVHVELGGRSIVTGANLQIPYGQLTVMIGPNGAGKSTLLDVLSGSATPQQGEVFCDGKPLSSYTASQLARRRAVMLQDTTVAFSYPVREVVAMGCQGDDEQARIAVDEALALLKIEHLQARDVMTLSGGERARVAMARVVAQGAEILLLDEPTAALDIGHQEHVMTVCKNLAEAGKAVLAIVHDLDLAFAHADRVAILVDGRIDRVGSVDEMRNSQLLTDTYGWPVDVLQHGQRQRVLPRRGEPDHQAELEERLS